MSKELEALEEIRDFRYGEDKLLVCQTEMYSTIKQALQRLESVDNANPSGALKDLQVIENNIIYILSDCDINNEVCKCLEFANAKISTIEQALIKAQEQEKENARYKKVFELVKEKGVDISIIMSTKNVEEYNGFIQYCNSNLSEVEYNLLKEMFG